MGGFGGQNRGRGGAILTPNELVLTFRGSYVCANFGENRSRNATVRVSARRLTDTQTDDTQTQTDFIICPIYAICYSYGTDNKYLGETTKRRRLVTAERLTETDNKVKKGRQ